MKDIEWVEHEYKRMRGAVKLVIRLRSETIQQIKFIRLNQTGFKEDETELFRKWVNLDRQLTSVQSRRDLLYRIWKQ